MITSSQNPHIKEALRLWKKNERDESGLFLIEGYRELSRALLKNVKIKTLFIAPNLFLGSNEEVLIEQVVGAKVIPCSDVVFKKLSYRDRPDGLLAIGYQKRMTLEEIPQQEGALYIVAESIEKPGNLGTILRTADATGADGVIVADRCTDIFNPNVIRASVGTCFTVPIIESSLDEVLVWLRKEKIILVATTPHADLYYNQVDYKGSVAIALGSEQYGLSTRLLQEAEKRVKIPMLGVADSLNVAMAASVLLYEVLAQRNIS